MPSVAERMAASDDTYRRMTSEEADDRMTQVSRAAYLMVKGSIAEDLVTREELTEALQFAGKLSNCVDLKNIYKHCSQDSIRPRGPFLGTGLTSHRG